VATRPSSIYSNRAIQKYRAWPIAVVYPRSLFLIMLGKWPYTLVSTETYYAKPMRSAKFLNSDPPLCLCAGVTRVSRRRTAPFWPIRLPLLRRSSLARSVRLVDMLVQNIGDTDMQLFLCSQHSNLRSSRCRTGLRIHRRGRWAEHLNVDSGIVPRRHGIGAPIKT
jgi:hypothetical protein